MLGEITQPSLSKLELKMRKKIVIESGGNSIKKMEIR